MKALSKSLNEIEVEGGSLEEAIEIALRRLGVQRKDAEVKILCEERKGLFGLEGSKQAKIKVKIKRDKSR